MQRLITKYGTAAHLAFLAVAPLFLSCSIQFWLCGLGLIWVLMEPSRVAGESLAAARRRSFTGLLRDPLLWVLLAALAYATLRLANGGVALAYEAERTEWTLATPHIPILPGSTSQAGWPELAGLTALFVVVLGIRHALGKAARSAMMALATVVSGAVALVWGLGLALDFAESRELAKCALSNPVYMGSFFGIYLVAALGVLPDILSRRWYAMLFPMLFAICGNAVGLFLFAPATLSAFWGAVALLMLVYAVTYAHVTVGPASGLQVVLISGLCLAGATMLVMTTAPSTVLCARTEVFERNEYVPKGFLEQRDTADRLSEAMWRTRPWTGVGLGAYPLALRFQAKPEDWDILPGSQKGALNGWWTLLVERGLVGALALGLPLVLLLWTYFLRLVKGLLRGFPSPLALWGLFVFLAIVAESFVASTVFLPVALMAAAVWLSISAYSFPKEKTNG